jgi:hypothetical protein
MPQRKEELKTEKKRGKVYLLARVRVTFKRLGESMKPRRVVRTQVTIITSFSDP